MGGCRDSGHELDEQLGHRGGDDGPAEVGRGVPGDVAERERQVRARRGRLHADGVVVVDPVEVERLGDEPQVVRDGTGHRVTERLGVSAQQDRVGEEAVPEDVEQARCRDVRLAVRRRPHGDVVGRRSQCAVGAGAQRLDRQPVREEEVVRGGERPEHQAARRRHLLLGVAHERHDVRLVHGAPVRDAVAQPLRHERGVLAEAQGGVPLEPPPGILERLREVPVEERRHRLDACFEQAVDEPVVEREARLVDGAAARRLHAGPGHREAVAVGAQALHEGDVLGPAVVVVAGHGPVGAVEDATGLGREGVPDAGAAAVLVDGALDLVGGGARAEDEVRRQAEVVASWVVAVTVRSRPAPHPRTPSSGPARATRQDHRPPGDAVGQLREGHASGGPSSRSTQVGRWSLAAAQASAGRATSRCGSTRSSGDANTTSSRRRGARAG